MNAPGPWHDHQLCAPHTPQPTTKTPGWGLDEPAYKVLEIHSGPGQTGMLNFYWLLEREAVSDERSGSFGLCTLGYSSSGWVHWPLIDAGSLSGMPNSYWPSAHPGSLGRLSGALNSQNSHWLSGGSSFSLTFWDEARREELPKMH